MSPPDEQVGKFALLVVVDNVCSLRTVPIIDITVRLVGTDSMPYSTLPILARELWKLKAGKEFENLVLISIFWLSHVSNTYKELSSSASLKLPLTLNGGIEGRRNIKFEWRRCRYTNSLASLGKRSQLSGSLDDEVQQLVILPWPFLLDRWSAEDGRGRGRGTIVAELYSWQWASEGISRSYIRGCSALRLVRSELFAVTIIRPFDTFELDDASFFEKGINIEETRCSDYGTQFHPRTITTGTEMLKQHSWECMYEAHVVALSILRNIEPQPAILFL